MEGTGEQQLYGHERDAVLWLTTTRRDGTPVSRPVWFAWDGASIVVYSRPASRKVAHLAERPLASAHFDIGAEPDDVVVLDVRARIERDAAPPSSLATYAAKYAEAVRTLGMTPSHYDALFTTAIRLEVVRQVAVLDQLPPDDEPGG